MVIASPQSGLNPKLFELSHDVKLSSYVLEEVL